MQKNQSFCDATVVSIPTTWRFSSTRRGLPVAGYE
jgi:hypothetical protein